MEICYSNNATVGLNCEGNLTGPTLKDSNNKTLCVKSFIRLLSQVPGFQKSCRAFLFGDSMAEKFESIGNIMSRQFAQEIIPRGESFLEDRFWEMMRKTERGLDGAIQQFEIGECRVDAIVDCNGKAVVVELDGAAFHK